VLRHFLDMPRIYKRDELAADWEAQARQNLTRELATLE
jgi:predicted metal-dependent HD superfamily phosphohydrolase